MEQTHLIIMTATLIAACLHRVLRKRFVLACLLTSVMAPLLIAVAASLHWVYPINQYKSEETGLVHSLGTGDLPQQAILFFYLTGVCASATVAALIGVPFVLARRTFRQSAKRSLFYTLAAALIGPLLVESAMDGANYYLPDIPYRTLLDAIADKHIEAARAQLILGVSANKAPWCSHNDSTPLCWAAQFSDKKTVALLLEHGADPNYMPIYKNDVPPPAPLVLAAEDDKIAILRLLIAHGARVNDSPNGSSALWSAASNNQPYAVSVLLASGANPNSAIEGQTILHDLKLGHQENTKAAMLIRRAGGRDESGAKQVK